MAYVQRENGNIVAAFLGAQSFPTEQVDDGDPDLAAFRARFDHQRFVGYAELRDRLTAAEREAILTARRTDWRVDDFLTLAQAGPVDLAGAPAQAAKAHFVKVGHLSKRRAEKIFA